LSDLRKKGQTAAEPFLLYKFSHENRFCIRMEFITAVSSDRHIRVGFFANDNSKRLFRKILRAA
jgi:hypothetical protein